LLKNNVKNRDPEYVPLGFNFFGSPYSKKKAKKLLCLKSFKDKLTVTFVFAHSDYLNLKFSVVLI